MALRALVMDRPGVSALLASPGLAESVLRSQTLPDKVQGIEMRQAGDIFYLLSEKATESDSIAVFRVTDDEMLCDIPADRRGDAFARILQAMMSNWDPTLAVPHSWRPFHRGSLLSFQTNTRNSEIAARAYVDNNPRGLNASYLFLVTDTPHGDLAELTPNYDAFDLAISGLPDAIAGPVVAPTSAELDNGETSFDLENNIAFDVTRGRSFKDWSSTYLTKEQLKFVAVPLDRSMRLRGAAGTGKTLALIIKFLKSCYEKIDQGAHIRVAFLAHSFATVELIRNYIYSVDDRGILVGDSGVDLVVTTLHDLSNGHLRYDLEGVTPISLDGQEGRELQFELLLGIVAKFKNSEWIRYQPTTSKDFRDRLESNPASPRHRGFVYDLMNEFACVIDAFGSKNMDDRRARYLKERRLSWMMALEQADRDVVLILYALFRSELRRMETISTDQMTSDYLGYLDSFRWDAKRTSSGFDFIFVDELHLFNRQERLTLHLLTNDADATPIVVMAYDPKQSPRDTFMDVPDVDQEDPGRTSWKDTKLGSMEAFEFDEVFRYTPEILQFLHCLDQSFPAEDFGAEWIGSVARSLVESGPTPKLLELSSTQDIYKTVFSEASRIAKQSGKSGRSIAVLCASYETFNTYLQAGEFKKSYLAITSRDEVSTVSHAGKRFIFSMPEYVAGLQFESVILIDANSGELEALGGGIGAKRRLVSTLYLGASRCERELKVVSNKERGGTADVLLPAIKAHSLII